MQPSYRGLAFLLSLGSLPLACTKDDGDTDGGSSGSTTPDTTAATDPGGSTTTGATGTTSTDPTSTTGTPTTDATTTGPVDTSTTTPQPTTFLTSESNSDTGFETEDEPLPVPTDPICIAYGQHVAECFPRYPNYRVYLAQTCEYYKAYGLRLDGQPCADAFDEYYVCISKVDCAEFLADDGPPSCAAQAMAIKAACPSIADIEIETDTDSGDDTGDTGGSSG